MNIRRAYYSSTLASFLQRTSANILGELAHHSGFAIELNQRDA
jgi:hypothetical protein